MLKTSEPAMFAPAPRQNRGRGWTGSALSRDRQTRYELALHSVFKRGSRQESVSKQTLTVRAVKSRVGRKSMAAKTKFRGSFTALVTPFKNGSLDEAAFRGLVNWQIAEGTHGLVPVGTTGESPTVNHDEHKRVVEWCIEEAKGRVPVIAGAGSNSTKEAIELSEHAERAGASAVLVVTPYYNKPTQEGMFQHFKAINDATASMVRVSQQRAKLGEDFNQLSGEDATVLGYMAHGGHGCISVTSNV